MSTGGGPVWYQGPEVPVCSPKGDVWGLGATVYKLAQEKEVMIPMPAWFPSRCLPSEKPQDLWYENPEARVVKPLPVRISVRLKRNLMDALERHPGDRARSDTLVCTIHHDYSIWKKRSLTPKNAQRLV